MATSRAAASANRSDGGWQSPRLQIWFGLDGTELKLRFPNGDPFLTYDEANQGRIEAEARTEKEARARQEAEIKAKEEAHARQEIEEKAKAEAERAEVAEQRVASVEDENRRLAEKLRALGVDI